MKRFNLFRVGCCGLLMLLGLTTELRAHVGSPNVFFQGQAGPYPVHVIIRPAEVIPGLAEISVRVNEPGIESVTALPIKWNAGRKGAPPPDVAKLVPGETNLYAAELWFMESGAQSVELEVRGAKGTGKVTIPVDAIARRVLTMPKGLGAMLAVLGLVLTALLISIIGAAIRESVLDPAVQPQPRRLGYARGAMAIAALVLVVLLWGGKKWWDLEAADYHNNRLYRALASEAKVRFEGPSRVLRLEITDELFTRWPLVPDHGKLMHMFIVREPGLDAFAHLHPRKIDRKTFDTMLPRLPAGSYRLYADITYETGFSDTVTTSVEIPEAAPDAGSNSPPTDPDDSWRITGAFNGNSSRECRFESDYTMSWLGPERIRANEPVELRFVVLDSSKRPVPLEAYLGMRGHLALRRDDGAVFTHLHPGGNASMAAMQLSTLRASGELPLKAAFGKDDPICQLPEETGMSQWLNGNPQIEEGVSFPYAFPKTGRYRLWVQVKVDGEILTGVYDLQVEPAGAS